jgi:hypothetical protein
MADELNGAAPAAAESTPAPSSEAPAAPSSEASTSSEPVPRSIQEIGKEIWNRHNPPRDGGKFAPRNPDAAPVEAAPGTTDITDQPEGQDTSVVATEPAAEPAIDPPRSWSAEMQAKFAALPPEVRNYVAERDKEVFRQVSQMGAQIKADEPVRQVLQEHQDYLQRIGHTPETALKQFFNVSRGLDQNPVAILKYLADAYRVDLRKLALSQQQAPAPTPTDPRTEVRIRRMEVEAEQRRQAEQVSREQSVMTAIEKYAQDKAHPHFDALEEEIIAQLPGIRALNPYLSPEQLLDMAYEKARWAHPTVRQRILMDQQKASAEKARAEQEKHIKDARRQSGINQLNGKGSTPVRGTLRETLERHAHRLMAK